jgi:hypothetical protein
LLENLKRKDPPILTSNEIIAATEEVERLTNFLKEDIAVAKVLYIVLGIIYWVKLLLNYFI